MDSEAQDICCEPANLAETPRAEESPSSDPHTVEPSRNDLLQHSTTESKPLSPEAEPPLRHSTHSRNPPDWPQYIKPLLNNIQQFLHGLMV